MHYGKTNIPQIVHTLKTDKLALEGGHLYLPISLGDEEDIQLNTDLYFGPPTRIDDATNQEYVPKAILDLGYDFVFLSDYLLDVFENLNHRKPAFTNQYFLQAFNYYVNNDSFIPNSLLLSDG